MSEVGVMNSNEALGRLVHIRSRIPLAFPDDAVAMKGALEVAMAVLRDDPTAEIRDLAESGLAADGAHHKQWYLAEIAVLCGVARDEIEDAGVMP